MHSQVGLRDTDRVQLAGRDGFKPSRLHSSPLHLPSPLLSLLQLLIHIVRRRVRRRPADRLGRHAGHGGVRRHRLGTTLPAATLAPSPTSMLPRIFAPAPIMTPRRIFGWRSPRLAGSAERHGLQHRNVVFDHAGLADHDAGRVIDEYAAADASRADEYPSRTHR